MKFKIQKPKPWVLTCYGIGALCIILAFIMHYLELSWLSAVALQRLFIVGGIIVCVASGANTYYTIRGRHDS